MIFLGLTGGLGSGKTTVATFFKEWGAEIHDADILAKELIQSDKRLKEKIQKTFGSDIYSADGELRTDVLAIQAFSSREKQEKLNALVHPFVREKIRRIYQMALKRKTGLLVIEASMLFEAGGEGQYDAILVVTASQQIRLERALKRGKLSREQILKRMSYQIPEEEKIRRADFVIHNDGSLEALKAKTEKIFQKLKQSI